MPRTAPLLIPIFALIANAYAGDLDLQTPARTIPLPAAASPELQAAIGNWPAPDVDGARKSASEEVDWTAIIAANHQNSLQRIDQQLARKQVKVTESTMGGAKVFRVSPTRVSAANTDRVVVFLHGGAYVFGQGRGGLAEAIIIAERIGIEVLSIDYRMPPAHPFPAALDDAVAAYAAIIEDYPPQSVLLGGTSAGGGLALATVHKLRALNIALPGALYLGTPWADMSKTGDTLYTNEGIDRVLVTYDGLLGAAARLYAGDHNLMNPLLSPVYGDFNDFPPAFLVTGTRDMFLSDVARTHRRLRAAGATADLHVYEGMSHAGYLLSPDTPESLEMYAELATFADQHLE